ncbi:hypothetical protein EJD97_017076 [Solanum chilense]|uniref:Uncharacterized protein n=1 Tax=Solanum chilense TaxID=4083 RepID=A0A6N2AL32_SOLCI|nr:hypothetical protein EJD97_017076 [Solanum chilense]
MLSSPFECKHNQMMLGVEMLSSPLGSIDGQTTSGIICDHFPLDSTRGRTTSIWYSIIVFVEHTRSDDVRRDMPSSS